MVSNRALLNVLKVILIFFISLVALGLLTVFVILPSLIRGETIEVPNVQGLSLWEASNKLARVGLGFELAGRRYDPSVPGDYVITQSPPASVNIRKDRAVKLTLSLGAEKVEVPDLVYKHRDNVEAILQSAGFVLGRVVHVHDDEIAVPGTILAQSPLPKSTGKRGEPIHLLVSDGIRPKLLLMPDLRNRELADVQKLLQQSGLIADVTYKADARLPAGRVVQHTPAPRQYARVGQTVQLVVSGASRTADQQRRPVTIRYQVSEGEETHHIRMVVEDALGSRELVNGFYLPGTIVSKPVVITGPATLRIYEDNMQQPVREDEL